MSKEEEKTQRNYLEVPVASVAGTVLEFVMKEIISRNRDHINRGKLNLILEKIMLEEYMIF